MLPENIEKNQKFKLWVIINFELNYLRLNSERKQLSASGIFKVPFHICVDCNCNSVSKFKVQFHMRPAGLQNKHYILYSKMD
jgi:hypothetical protein